MDDAKNALPGQCILMLAVALDDCVRQKLSRT